MHTYHILCHQPIFESFERRLQIRLLQYIVTSNTEHRKVQCIILQDMYINLDHVEVAGIMQYVEEKQKPAHELFNWCQNAIC